MIRVAVTIAAAMLGACRTGPAPAASSEETFARFKALEGLWQADFGDVDMPPSTLTYRTIANGSAVVETAFAGTPSEMITVIHPDGDTLRLTHYCAARNQPHLLATSIGDDTVEFSTDHVTNHANPAAVYMGEVRWTFFDEDHVQTRWWSFADGKRGEPVTFDLTRTEATEAP